MVSKCRLELLEMRHFAIRKLSVTEHVFVVGELHQVFVDDLGARFGGDVRTQVVRSLLALT